MKITILTYGSRGDVEPFVALGIRLCQSGHQVRLVGPEVYQSRFSLPEIEYIPLPGDPARLVQDLIDQAGTNGLQMFSSMAKFVIPLASQVFSQSRDACRDADAILHSFLLTSTGIGLGGELGIPTISAQLFPVFSSTTDFPAPTFPDLPLGGAYRQLTHNMVTRSFKWGSRMLYNWLRMKNPHLPKLTEWAPGNKGMKQIPILYGFSSHVVPRPTDWAANSHITGYWLLDDEYVQDPPSEAVDFLRSGQPPVTVALGSTRTRRFGEIKRIVIKALADCKQRGIIVTDQLKSVQVSPDLLEINHAPYDWLFKRSAAIVHHGGAGTTARGLLAGVPNIVIPFTSDQPFWGRQVFSLGAGPQSIPARSLTEKKLAGAINQAINDQIMRSKVIRVSELLNNEDGTSQAVRIIENYLAGGENTLIDLK